MKLAFSSYLKSGSIDKAVAIRGVHDDNRITKIKIYSSKYFRNMLLLNESRFLWSQKQLHLNSSIKKDLKLRYLSYKIANKNGFLKYMYFLMYGILHPHLLKTRYRFIALKKHVV